jgi:hypothetical protein
VSPRQRCVDRWNNNLGRFGGALRKVPEISSYTAHVGLVRGLCVVVVSRHGGSIVFAAPHRQPPKSGSDYTFLGGVNPSEHRQIAASFRVPNAVLRPDLTLTLK